MVSEIGLFATLNCLPRTILNNSGCLCGGDFDNRLVESWRVAADVDDAIDIRSRDLFHQEEYPTMSRTTGVPDKQLGLRARVIYWLTKRRRGRIHLATRVRAYDPKLLELAFRMDLHTAAQRTVPSVLKELAQIKVAVMVGCPF
jgi:hypothetical protein